MTSFTQQLIDKVIEKLRNAASELEEFQLQFALGKAEAADKYEEIKQELREIIQNVKIELKEDAGELKAKLDELLLKLRSGRVEDKEAFHEQEKKIAKLIDDLLDKIKASDIGAEVYAKLHTALQKFKIKMEIVYLYFSLKKIDIKQDWEEGRKEFHKKADVILQELKAKKESFEKNHEHMFDELNKAYKHLKKAFTEK